jgi:hypothetical protein
MAGGLIHDGNVAHDREHVMEEHMHSAQKVSPSGAGAVTLTSGGGVWALGNFSNDIVAAGAITDRFDLHWIDIAAPDTNAEYEIVLYQGATDVEIARVVFERLAGDVRSFTRPLQTMIIPANARIRAKMMDDTGGSTARVKIYFHTY